MDSATGSPLLKRGEGLPIPRRYVAIVAVALGTALAVIDGSIVTVALPTLAHDLGVASSAAGLLSVSGALIRAIYPAPQVGRGLGINTVVVSSGNALAPTLGGLVLSVATWPWIFAAAAPLAVLSLVLGRQALPAPEPH